VVCRSVVNDDGAEMIDRGREPPATRARVSGSGSLRRVIAVVPISQYCAAGHVAGLRIGSRLTHDAACSPRAAGAFVSVFGHVAFPSA